jgi:hypothetical protein
VISVNKNIYFKIIRKTTTTKSSGKLYYKQKINRMATLIKMKGLTEWYKGYDRMVKHCKIKNE